MARQREPVVLPVDADHAAAVGAQQLHGQQADQAQSVHDHRFAQRRLGEADALQADGRHRRERRGLEAHPVGDPGRQRVRHAHQLGVRAVGHDAVAGTQPGHAAAGLDDGPRAAVAQRDRGLELRAHGLERGRETVGLHLRDDVADPVRLAAHLVQQAAAAELDQHALGARRNEAAARVDQHLLPADRRPGHVGDGHRAGIEPLEHLLHRLPPISRPSAFITFAPVKNSFSWFL